MPQERRGPVLCLLLRRQKVAGAEEADIGVAILDDRVIDWAATPAKGLGGLSLLGLPERAAYGHAGSRVVLLTGYQAYGLAPLDQWWRAAHRLRRFESASGAQDPIVAVKRADNLQADR
jgi:hypothetical protein